jgi:hypothetical protein
LAIVLCNSVLIGCFSNTIKKEHAQSFMQKKSGLCDLAEKLLKVRLSSLS